MAFSLTCSGAGVVCFGADGHVEIELDCHNHCGDDDHEAASDWAIGARDRGPCTDIPLETGPAGEVKIQKTAAAGAGVQVAIVKANTAFQTKPFTQTDLGLCSYFSPLRDIVLLN